MEIKIFMRELSYFHAYSCSPYSSILLIFSQTSHHKKLIYDTIILILVIFMVDRPILLIRKGDKDCEEIVKKVKDKDVEIVEVRDNPYLIMDIGTAHLPVLITNYAIFTTKDMILAYLGVEEK